MNTVLDDIGCNDVPAGPLSMSLFLFNILPSYFLATFYQSRLLVALINFSLLVWPDLAPMWFETPSAIWRYYILAVLFGFIAIGFATRPRRGGISIFNSIRCSFPLKYVTLCGIFNSLILLTHHTPSYVRSYTWASKSIVHQSCDWYHAISCISLVLTGVRYIVINFLLWCLVLYLRYDSAIRRLPTYFFF